MTDERVALALHSEDRRFAAMASSDLGILEEVLADDLHYTHANGIIETKAEFIDKIRRGDRQYLAIRLVRRTCSVQPGFVAVFGQVEVEVARKAGLLSNSLDYTAIYRDVEPRLFIWSAVKSYEAV
ncbi:nuclear transport factor 2 family protein [Brevundimonas sp.]|uniref:nuclear transport factor 2 family protein n=1 Tax=Brevundimonas sp. TaxID=1871086 RepID=UPI003D095CE4